jgi:hypothetical protein
MGMILPIVALAVGLWPLQDNLSDDLSFAPPAREVDGLLGVPMDIQSLSATLIFDLEARTKEATADLVFKVGETGYPIFDLRQNIRSATLDMKPIKPETVSTFDMGPQSGTMRLLEWEIQAGAPSILQLAYDLEAPDAPAARGALKRENGLFFSTNFTDLKPGRYLEQWFPANLIYDRFSFELELQLKNAKHEHLIFTNADVEELDRHSWRLRWPEYTTAFSPMLVIAPKADIEVSTKTVKCVKDQKIKVTIAKDKKSSGSLKSAHKKVSEALRDFSKTVGPWPHGDRCTVYLRDSSGSMEYDGATTTAYGAIRHEIFHSWFGRGVKPRSQNDAWWDEAWDVWFADGGRYSHMDFSKPGEAITLCGSNPWNRITARQSYGKGAQFFARVAHLIGEKKLRSIMSDFFKENALQTASTQEMESFLIEKSGNSKLQTLFNRYVYGQDDLGD